MCPLMHGRCGPPGRSHRALAFFVSLQVRYCRTKIGQLEDAPARERCQNVSQMTATEIKKTQRTGTGNKAKSEAPWNVILHNDWDNSMVRVVIVLKKVIPGMTIKRATAIMWEAHRRGRAVVKSCHKELAELYEDRLQTEGLTVSIEPAR
jgi:ATP-dependent Clp protease adaptor protein ClpS